MKISFILAFVVAAVYANCPTRDELHCWMYDRDLEGCTNVKNTFIEYNGNKCDACRICLDSAVDGGVGGCPAIPCPYGRLEEVYPMDCGVFPYDMKVFIDGMVCDACATYTKDCSDLSWIG